MNKFIKCTSLLPVLAIFGASIFAQETPPAPSAPRSVTVPPVKEKKLPNGLTVVVVEKRNSPLVTAQLLITSGANTEDMAKAGLANTTASALTKGTKTRTATQIAEAMEFLGGSINAGAGWNNSNVTATFTSDKLDKAVAILADVVLNPSFKQDEVDLVKSQSLDGLTYNLKQPGFLANYVASRYSFNEHPAGGTPESIKGLTRDDLVGFHKDRYIPNNAVLIFTGDITQAKANALALQFFGRWKTPPPVVTDKYTVVSDKDDNPGERRILRRILVIDLPDSGQAAVKYLKKGEGISRGSTDYYPASVLNSLLGGGYSSRLNQEIRIKRGLSYGAGSSFSWRGWKTNFSTSTQTKNESADEVAELVVAEIKKLGDKSAGDDEIGPRKLVLNGTFGSSLETTGGIAGLLSELFTFDLPSSNLNSYMFGVRNVHSSQVRNFAYKNLRDGDIIIVGDAKFFLDDLKKRFPRTPIETIKADDLDVSTVSLRKGN
jgi:zinc protease